MGRKKVVRKQNEPKIEKQLEELQIEVPVSRKRKISLPKLRRQQADVPQRKRRKISEKSEQKSEQKSEETEKLPEKKKPSRKKLPELSKRKVVKNNKVYRYTHIGNKTVRDYNKEYSRKWRTPNPNGKYKRIKLDKETIALIKKRAKSKIPISQITKETGFYWAKIKKVINGDFD